MVDSVVDATVICSIFLNEEGCEKLKDRIAEGGNNHAPAFWRFEVANAVWKRKEITEKVGRELIHAIWQFPLNSSEPNNWAEDTYSIAKRFGITFYDASYIAMAKLLKLPLWTLDKRQMDVARQCRIQIFD